MRNEAVLMRFNIAHLSGHKQLHKGIIYASSANLCKDNLCLCRDTQLIGTKRDFKENEEKISKLLQDSNELCWLPHVCNIRLDISCPYFLYYPYLPYFSPILITLELPCQCCLIWRSFFINSQCDFYCQIFLLSS